MRPAAARQSGFTLLEMIVVIAVLGLAMAAVLGSLPPRSARADVRAAGSALAGSLRAARGRAIATDQPVAVVLDPVAHAWRVGAGPVTRVPDRVIFAASRPAIVFAPDGSSTGGRIGLISGTIRQLVDVSWLTGRVTVAEAK